MNKSKSRFAARDEKSFERKRNTREERQVKEDLPKIVFSFKDFDTGQIPPGQSYDEWQEEKRLAYALEKFGEIGKCNRVEAQQQGLIKVYKEFPATSKFKYPRTVIQDDKIVWAVIMNIKGQKPRVVGHMIENVFYVVFLDAEHCFFPSELKHT